MTLAGNKADFEPTSGIPYLTLIGELWGVYCVSLENMAVKVL